jgi:hypothetical protein
MPWWPGWNSVEGAAKWGNVFFWAGIACLILLAATEIISKMYGSRKDELVAIADSARLAEQQKKSHEIAERHSTEVRELKAQHASDAEKLQAQVGEAAKKVGEATKKVAELEKGQADRGLDEPQRKALIKALSPFRGQNVRVVAVLGSDDALAYAHAFVSVFKAAGWNVNPSSPSQAVYDRNPVGLEATLNEQEVAAGAVPESYEALLAVLGRLGLANPKVAYMNSQAPKGFIEFRVGSKATAGAKVP